MQAEKSIDTDVLFQKLGNVWYAFSEINNEFVYSALPKGIDPHETKIELFDVIESHLKKVAGHYKRRSPEVAA